LGRTGPLHRRSPRLYALRLGQDDPRKCTSGKLSRFGLLVEVGRPSSIPRRAILLDPFSDRVLTPGDRELLLEGGLAAVDCSWERAEEVFSKRIPGIHRRLPLLMAANPTKFAKPGVLSSAEALAAALFITGFKPLARRLLGKFKWGGTFFDLNRDPLRYYSMAGDEARIRAEEAEIFGFEGGMGLEEA
jgi:pre-rRNA-processing protein TSR3